jgi:triosephosphate isomerase
MPRKPLIAANWKMYKTPAQAQEFFKNFLPLVANHDRDEIVVCPSFTSISVVIAAATGSGVAIGAQNMHFADEGAYTGETSPVMLKAISATHVILGHSERRQYFAETDELINKKLKAALAHQLIPIVCVGEVLAEREEAGKTNEVLIRQTRGVLAGIPSAEAAPIVIASAAIRPTLCAFSTEAASNRTTLRRSWPKRRSTALSWAARVSMRSPSPKL